ncbi:MAG: methylenetetrahydrofolate reductase C-terminal domain-containing protein [Candidatus Omnitrophica bacterium]|nr:methylenetetrahydrofolate reductase C-terminal domain-containing protein [Candidatus Omnitrophota bacterium]MDD5500568.1 methylenetetrahydrofolate reductase C-terminal domain-containing protein [Candidatus Omnitrophota bacterium]
MIISRQKPIEEILSSLEEYDKVFLVGCGECATACKSGGQPELDKMKQVLISAGKDVVGMCLPSAPCLAAPIKTELAKNLGALRNAEVVLVLACGLGAQSVKSNNRFEQTVIPANNTIFGAVMDGQGNFYEKCSMCAECMLARTGGICPYTLCPKGLLNGPCGGMNRGKCEVDGERDCAWVLIYREMEKHGALDKMKEINQGKDYSKSSKPHKLLIKEI